MRIQGVFVIQEGLAAIREIKGQIRSAEERLFRF